MRFALLLLAMFAPLSEAGAATYFMRDGSECANNGNGTARDCAASAGAAGAFRNISGLLGATLSAGDIVYNCSNILLASSAALGATAESGSAGTPIVLDMLCPIGNGAYFQGSFDAQRVQNYALSLTTGGPSHWTVRNGLFKNAANDCVNLNLSTATGWRFENSVAQDCAADGFDVDDMADGGIDVDGLTVYRAAQSGIACTSTTGNVWRRLRVHDSGTSPSGSPPNWDGIAINDGCGDSKLLIDVRVYNQRSENGGGIDLQDSTGTGTLTLSGAYVEGSEGAGYTAVCNAGTQTIRASSVVLSRNKFSVYLKDCGGQHVLSHFSSAGATSAELKVGDTGTSGDSFTATVRNSLFCPSAGVSAVYWRNNASVTLDSNYNLFCPGGTFDLQNGADGTLALWKVAGQDASSQETDAMLVGGANPTSLDGFRPRLDSPLCGAGTYVGKIFDKTGRRIMPPVTIGAFQCANGRAPSLR